MCQHRTVSTTHHEPAHWSCPFCRLQRGEHDPRNQPSDIVAVTERAFARIAPKWWPGNPGGVLVIPRAHTENLYSIAPEDNRAVWDLVREVAIAIRETYDCEGTSVRQHNEPAGDQDVWHLHVHVFPRHRDDALYERHREARWVSPEERAPFAERLRARLGLPHVF